jgi:Flp pilus assembly protein TadG
VKRVKTLFTEDGGAAVTELALVAPILAVLAAGIIDISSAYSRKLALEQGAQRAIEKIMQTTDDNTVENTLKTEAICQVNGMLPNGQCGTAPITTANVTVTYKIICRSNAGVAASTRTSTDPVAFDLLTCPSTAPVPNRFIEVSITDTFQGIFIHRFNRGSNLFQINAAAGMRTQ